MNNAELKQSNNNDSLHRGRVVSRNREQYILLTSSGELKGTLSGKFQHIHGLSDYPVVGDYVYYESTIDGPARIADVEPRKSKFSRKEAGKIVNEQVLAANIDIVFIVTGLDQNFNVSRILRYRTVALEGGAKPVIILNKLDLCYNLDEKLAVLRAVVENDPIHAVSTWTGEGLDAIKAYLKADTTIAFFGSSGVGKSSITNALMDKTAMSTGEVSAFNGKGRHTTTTAELCQLPGGGYLIDTPGMRELQIWCNEDAVEVSFGEITLLAEKCQFDNCRHGKEPGCEIRKALRTGRLSEQHFNSYIKLKNEARFIEAKQKQKERMSNRPVKKDKPRMKRIAID